MKESVCSPNIKIVGIAFRPYYLLREFTNLVIVTVYILPPGNVEAAYSHTALPPLSRTDHNLVLFFPSNKSFFQQQPITVR